MMQYYSRDDEGQQNCEAFRAITQNYPDLRFFQPSPDKAPWHVQVILDAEDGEPLVLNFWPHKLKGARQGFVSVEGVEAIRGIIEGAISDAEEEPFDVIEAAE